MHLQVIHSMLLLSTLSNSGTHVNFADVINVGGCGSYSPETHTLD